MEAADKALARQSHGKLSTAEMPPSLVAKWQAALVAAWGAACGDDWQDCVFKDRWQCSPGPQIKAWHIRHFALEDIGLSSSSATSNLGPLEATGPF